MPPCPPATYALLGSVDGVAAAPAEVEGADGGETCCAEGWGVRCWGDGGVEGVDFGGECGGGFGEGVGLEGDKWGGAEGADCGVCGVREGS